MRTGKWRDHGIACSVALAWHVLMGWYLIRVTPLQVAAADDPALQVIYIPARLPPRSHVAPRGMLSKRVVERPVLVRREAAAVMTKPGLPVPALPAEARPLSATFLDQAHAWAQRETDGNIPRPDPFASRQPHLPGERDGRFLMQRPRAPGDLVAAVGGYLFAPVGYQADPCPRNRTNIGNLMAGQDAKAMQQELDFERRHCRP